MKKTVTNMYARYRHYWSVFLLTTGLLIPALGQAQSTTVVISEVYVGGGGSGAAYKNDFVELYNKSGATITLTNYSLQYKPAATTGAYTVVSLGSPTLQPNQYLLVQLAGAAAAIGSNLPTPDVSSSLSLATTGGRIALVNSLSPLMDGDPATAPGVVDFLGYGSGAATYEGSAPAASIANSESLERKARAGSTSLSMGAGGDDANQGNGYDSNDNASDFVTRDAPEPQNSSSTAEVLTPDQTYYNTKNPTGALNELSTYSTTMDGTGPSPVSFAIGFQTFMVMGTKVLGSNWTVSGPGSRIVLAANTSLTVPATVVLTSVLDMRSGASLVEYNATPGITYGNLDITSTVEFAQAVDYVVPVAGGAGYGNLTLRNAAKHLDFGNTVVRGNMVVSNVGASSGGGVGGPNTNLFGGSTGAGSVLMLGGKLTLAGTVRFSNTGDDRITLVATNTSSPQTLEGGGNVLKLFRLVLPTGQAGVSLTTGTTSLELGSTTGGGYQLASGTVLTVNANTLAFVAGGRATFSGTGALAVDATSSLVLDKNSTSSLSGTASAATMFFTPGSTQLKNLTLNALGGSIASNTLILSNSLTVTGTLTITTGTLGVSSGRTLTINGVLNAQNGFFNGADASFVVGGSGSVSFMYFRGGSGNQLRSFTMARPNQTLYLGSTITLTESLNITGGVLATTNTINLNGSVMTSGTGQLQTSVTANLIIGGSGPLGNVVFTDAGGFLNSLVLDRAGETLNLEGITVSIRNPTLTAGVLHVGNDLALNITGPLVVADPAVAKFGVTPTSSISFTSYNNSTAVDIGPLAFVPGQDVMNALTMARSAGTAANPLFPPVAQLTTSLTVRTLVLTRGSFYVQGNNRLSVLPGGGLVGGSVNSYTNTLTLASVTNANPIFATLGFPLGVNGEYRPLTFSVTDAITGTTSYTARQFEAPAPSRTLPPTLLRVSHLRYYNLVAEAGGSSVLQSATIRLSYDPDGDMVTPGNTSLLRVAMTDPADNTRWKDLGGSGNGANITSTPFPMGPLGDFVLATDANTPTNTNPLPVELSAFSAQRQPSKAVSVRWTTASEKNSDYFEVQRSLNARDFVTVATAKAQGSSNQATAYAALDQTAPAAELYYRLRQVDRDGTVNYSPVLRVAGFDTPIELTLYPNPATDRLTATAPALANRTYRVLNTLGQVLTSGSAEAENPAVDVRALPTGTYLLELSGPGGRQTRRFVKSN